ncbi:MAG: helix-turn-helix transcriptional regulator [Sphingobium sp.]
MSRMGIRDILARNLKRIRLERGWSQEELGYRAEIDRTCVNALERPVDAPGIDVPGRGIAKILDMEPATSSAMRDDKRKKNRHLQTIRAECRSAPAPVAAVTR